jgi:hypothetical protein
MENPRFLKFFFKKIEWACEGASCELPCAPISLSFHFVKSVYMNKKLRTSRCCCQLEP